MNWLIFYDKETLQIEQYVSSSSIMPTPASLSSYNSDKHNMAELVDPPFGISRDRKVVLEDGMVVGTMPNLNPFQPASPEPPKSSHISVIDVIDTIRVRPVRIKRVWKSKDYFYDCLVTESVKDQYVAGDVAVGDYVLVHFDDIGEQIVIAKVFKSW